MAPQGTLRFEPRGAETSHIRAADETLGSLIDQIGAYEIELNDDRFVALARAIVGQQLSLAAARTIWSRFVELVGAVSPDTVSAADHDSMRSIGLSNAKARYIHGLALAVLDGSINLERLDALDDEAVIDALTQLKGVGRWTAEMFLIFSLGRPDVFSPADVGLQRAMQLLYGLPAETTPQELIALAQPWAPYRSAASLYLWKALDQSSILGDT